MAGEANGGAETLSPDDAFAVLGDETRVRILRTLGEADEALSFSELRDRVGTRDSGRFNYHLDKLVGHFVEKTDGGYSLRRAGGRVVEAILSGAVTEAPVLDRTRIDQTCHYCGAPTEVSFRQGQVASYCTSCAGAYGQSSTPEHVEDAADSGFLGYLSLPPAGVRDRTAPEVHRAALTWQMAELLPAASGVCPRCSAPLEQRVETCEDHDAADGLCEACNSRYAVQHYADCTNCIYDQAGAFAVSLLAETELLAFLTTHGVNPVAPSGERFATAIMDYEEEVRSTDPFEARFTFAIDGDAITLTVGDDLQVVDIAR